MKSREKGEKYRLVLYVGGWTLRTESMVAAIRSVCEDAFPGRYQFDVVDILEEPEQAEANQVVATPTLVVIDQNAPRRIVGDVTTVRSLRQALRLACAG